MPAAAPNLASIPARRDTGDQATDKTARARLAQAYARIRADTEALARGLSPEDQTVQSMPDASPTKWHRAHTTWFFETVVLDAYVTDYVPHNPAYGYLFNSYYEALGQRHPRHARGLLTRPSCDEVAVYRRRIDARMSDFIEKAPASIWRAAAPLIELGVHHEQQHQELLLTDILHAFWCNPLLPAYRSTRAAPGANRQSATWVAFPGGVTGIGHEEEGFAFDNECPFHEVALRPFALRSRPVTNADWLSFMADDGYSRPELWLSDGWAAAQDHRWRAPLYWKREDDAWVRFSLHGLGALDTTAPVTNISYYEADAYARWAGHRLPTEAEWEIGARTVALRGNLLSSNHPNWNHLDARGPDARGLDAQGLDAHGATGDRLSLMFGDVWEWTQSPYTPYPGFTPNAGAVGEYNGKFMVNQMVLRGGSCLTPADHIRATYRNFFYPATRWQCAGLRLAKDL